MNEKQQQLTFEKGMTNVPSDAVCSDNALEECVGMAYDNGEYRVIQKPAVYMTGAKTVLYIHKQGNTERYITRDGNDIKWGTRSAGGAYVPAQVETQGVMVDVVLLTTTSSKVQVTSVGKTLIINDGDGLHYFLWNSAGYKDLGSKIPEPNVRFRLAPNSTVFYSARLADCNSFMEYKSDNKWHVRSGKQDDYDNAVIGLYSSCKDAIHDQNEFLEPFSVVVAVELYDGTYTYATNPIMLFPCVDRNTRAVAYNGNNYDLYVYVYGRSILYCSAGFDYRDWSDIVKDVVVFASKEVEIHDLGATHQAPGYDDSKTEIFNGVKALLGGLGRSEYRTSTGRYDDDGGFRPISFKTDGTIKKELAENALFYRLASLGTYRISTDGYLPCIIEPYTVKNLTSQKVLPNDYFSRAPLMPGDIYVYNSRLNLTSANRGFFEGFGHFLPYDNDSSANYEIFVTIRTDSGDFVVKHEVQSTEKQGIYFYYPDPRAIHACIRKGNKWVLNVDLTEHPGLHGAYYFRELPPSNNAEIEVSAPDPIPSVSPNPQESLPNYIIQSDVNNPFVFKAEGYHKVGTGKILGISTQTRALSEGQFGQYPLIVFSESGIWALPVTSEGLYSSIQPMSREVALPNNPCITQTDGAVFFASKKGLMVVVGSDVRCVSEQLGGKPPVSSSETPSLVTAYDDFASFLQTAFIAYDYRDSLLWIFDNKTRTENNVSVTGSRYCWVYSIKSQSFARFDFGQDNNHQDIIVGNVVNDYPDYLLQCGTTVYSLLDRVNINEDSDLYASVITSRPMKLENALALKSIMQIRHILQFTPYTVTETAEDPETHESVTTTSTAKGTMALRIYASNNLDNWVELHSLRGMPWKYYKLRFDFANMKATDRFAGTMLVTQERRTNKLR